MSTSPRGLAHGCALLASLSLFGSATGLSFVWWLWSLSRWTALLWLGMALLACVAGSLGHLVMKALKRDRGITSWGMQGMSVTGAGGLLDRVDALCFAAPVFFHSARWYFGL